MLGYMMMSKAYLWLSRRRRDLEYRWVVFRDGHWAFTIKIQALSKTLGLTARMAAKQIYRCSVLHFLLLQNLAYLKL